MKQNNFKDMDIYYSSEFRFFDIISLEFIIIFK